MSVSHSGAGPLLHAIQTRSINIQCSTANRPYPSHNPATKLVICDTLNSDAMPPKRTTKKTTAGTSKATATTGETTSPLKRKRAEPAKSKGKGKGKGKAPAEPTQTPPPSSSFNSAAEIVADQAQRSEADHFLSPAEAEEALDEVDEDEDDDEDAGFDLSTFIKGTLVDRRSGKNEKPVEEEERTEEEKAAAALWDDSTLRKAFIPTSLPIG